MKVEVQVQKTETIETTIDVEFPIYLFDPEKGRQSWNRLHYSYLRIDQDGTEYRISTVASGAWEYEIRRISLKYGLAHILDQCTTIPAVEFHEILAEFRAGLDKIPSPPSTRGRK